ncbi:MAG: hypothetical protein GQ532_07280 [Methylomarinum sp.]|nr:hypothetical protein [Methylomarinum sp.]
MKQINTTNSNLFIFAFSYCLFIIYGSLVPLDYNHIPFEEALLSFKQIPYLNLGAAFRADWIANIILYIPLTFSLAAYFTGRDKSYFKIFIISFLILCFSLTLAVTIEFYQQFFPPRTVSQNDLIAESIGSVIGLTLWLKFGYKLLNLFSHISLGGKNALRAFASLYVIGYLFISFFPYDFITSFSELENKLSQGSDAFFISDSCGGVVRCSSKLISEIALTVPLGILISTILKWHPQRLIAVILIGFLFGAIIESIQLFLISGIAQGLSILMRIIGFALGEKLYTNINFRRLYSHIPSLRKYLSIALIPYFFLLASLNGWSFNHLQLESNIAEQLYKINWLPFYYHYYSTEAVALNSLLSIVLMYFPIGLGLWLWNHSPNIHRENTKFKAGIYAFILCFIMEASKLFLASKHPDPTNLLISFFSAFVTYSLSNLVFQWLQQPEAKNTTNSPVVTKNPLKSTYNTTSNQGTPIEQTISFTLFIILIWKTIDYPINSIGLACILFLYGFLLKKYSQIWLITLPALLPILDFAPWTGRFFFSEFDHFILLTLAINIWYGRHLNPFRYFKKTATILLSLFFALYTINLLTSLLPLQSIDENAFSNYYSHYNSLRVAKGVFWAFLLLPSLNYTYQQTSRTKELFAYGILLGLTGVILSSIWERFLFPGLFNFSSDYRITALFSSMHTGGGHIDTYLVTTIPFISILFFNSNYHLIRVLSGTCLFITSLYVLLVTFSRGPYFAFSIQLIMLSIFLFISRKKQQKLNWKNGGLIPIILLIIPLVSIPVFKGDFIQQRFGQISDDFYIRTAHWNDAIQMMDDDIFTSLFGMGLGTYPKTYFLSNSENTIPATYAIIKDKDNNNFLRLWSGDSLYIEQKIDTKLNSKYILSVNYRSDTPPLILTVSICEKGLLYSFDCIWQKLHQPSEKDQWVQTSQLIDTKPTGSNSETFIGKLSKRPIKIALYNGNKNTVIDIRSIKLIDSSKIDLIRNGDFSEGLDHWFFSTDNHLPWHSKNIWIQILFEQGWLGIIIFSGLVVYACSHQFELLRQKNSYSAILLTSLTGFFIVGTVASPFDASRITLLFFLTLFFSFLSTEKTI